MLFISFEQWLCTKFHTNNLEASKSPISARFVHMWTVDRHNYKAYCKNDHIHILHDTLLRSIWNFGLPFISSRNDHVQNFTQKNWKQVSHPYRLVLFICELYTDI